jgi:hypothetical protein
MNVTVIDDVIPPALQNTIEKILLNAEFPLYWRSNTVTYVENQFNPALFWDKNTKDSAQLIHGVVVDGVQISDYWSVLRTILYYTIAKTNKELEVLRCKVNVNFPHKQFSEMQYLPPHIDTVDQADFTAIYYVNDSDGDTMFFETPSQNKTDEAFLIKQTVTPKKGRMAFFDNKTVHCGKPPQQSDARCVINFNFKQVGSSE